MGERLQKILARAGVASRRAAERLIQQGRVSVDGVVVTERGVKADPTRQRIFLDGVLIHFPDELVYIALNKPRGYVTTRVDPHLGTPIIKIGFICFWSFLINFSTLTSSAI